MRHDSNFAVKILYLVFEYTFKYRVRMAQMSLHYLYNQKIIFLHMDVKERTDDLHCRANLRLFMCDVSLSLLKNGGPGWTRTSDPTLIKRVL